MSTIRRYFRFIIFLIMCNAIHTQTFQSLMILCESGTDFIPANPIELIDTYTDISTLISCFYRCHMNVRCRTFVSDLTWPFTCRLYEGLLVTGVIDKSSSSTSYVGGTHYYPSHYIYYKQLCDPHLPAFDPYLVCTNGSWLCPVSTFWNGSMCLNDVYYNDACDRDDVCRQDIGLHCDLSSKKCQCNSTAVWNGIVCNDCITVYGKCGSLGWTGSNNCCTNLICTYINNSMSQCLPTMIETTFLTSRDFLITTASYGNNNYENGMTDRSWDCCKTSCGWPDKANVTSPVRTCSQDGITPVHNNTQSICSNGSACVCNEQQPWNVSTILSYGYASAHINGQAESDWCCACYSLIFTSSPVTDKEIIVQVTNTNYNSGNSFGLQIPASGWGSITNGCSLQFNGSYSWGQQNGGISNRLDCNNLPNDLQQGCYWRFDWFMNADNPTVKFQKVPCPSALTAKTGCIRL